jgi:hypothetical protein
VDFTTCFCLGLSQILDVLHSTMVHSFLLGPLYDMSDEMLSICAMFSCYAMSNNDDDLYIHLQIIAIEYIHLQTHITDNMNNKLADMKNSKLDTCKKYEASSNPKPCCLIKWITMPELMHPNWRMVVACMHVHSSLNSAPSLNSSCMHTNYLGIGALL